MTLSLAPKDMTVEEKLRVMEAIWNELSRNSDEVRSREWRGEVLSEREAPISRSEVKFENWQTARK